jgi:hypothetical protein
MSGNLLVEWNRVRQRGLAGEPTLVRAGADCLANQQLSQGTALPLPSGIH